MSTGNRVAICVSKKYGFRFFREFCKWRRAGFGIQESLSRIRVAHRNGWSPIY